MPHPEQHAPFPSTDDPYAEYFCRVDQQPTAIWFRRYFEQEQEPLLPKAWRKIRDLLGHSRGAAP